MRQLGGCAVAWMTCAVLGWAAATVEAAQPLGPPRVPDAVRLEADISYADSDHPRQRLDLLLPRKPASDKPLPVVAFIHGGAWLGGDKRGGWGNVTSYVVSGQYAGVSIGYRLSQDAKWPAQIHDCKAAIRWLRGNAKKYNLDPERIGVWGASAGGHLVAMLGTSGDVKDLEGTLGKHADLSSRVQCVVDYFGPSDFLTIGKYPSKLAHDAADSPEAKLIGGAIAERQDAARNASPVTFATKDDPPFLILHGDKDDVVPYNQSERMDEALKKAGASSVLVKVEGAGHGFGGEEINRRVRQFFDKHLRGVEATISDAPIAAPPRPGSRPDRPAAERP